MPVCVYRCRGAVWFFGAMMMGATLFAEPSEARDPPGFAVSFSMVPHAAFKHRWRRGSDRRAARIAADRKVRRYCSAAWSGDRRAQFELGYMYALGRGVRRDSALAAAWFKKAAALGQPQARNWLKLLRVKARAKPECMMSDGLPLGAKREFAQNPAKGPIVKLVRSLAPQYHLDPNLVLAVVAAESNFDPSARSDRMPGIRSRIYAVAWPISGGCSNASTGTSGSPLPVTMPASRPWSAIRGFRLTRKPGTTLTVSLVG